MVPHWLRTSLLCLGIALAGVGCVSSPNVRGTVSLGPEGAERPVTELPNKESAYLCLVTAHEFEKTERAPEAIALYEKARALEPSKDKTICLRLAVLYDQVGAFAKADEEYAKAQTYYPKNADLLNDLGYSYYCRGNWAQAENYLNQAVALNPQHKRAWINLGLAIAQQNRYPESMRAFRHVVSEAEALCNLAFVLAAQGKKEESQQTYRRAQEIAPNLQLAQAALQRYNGPEASAPQPAPVATVKTEPAPAPQSAQTSRSPYGAVKATPTSRPTKTNAPVEEPTPLVIDPDLDSLPSRPKVDPSDRHK
jgi:Flp pilus assembly protein TadD